MARGDSVEGKSKIGVANAAAGNLYDYFIRARLKQRKLAKRERLLRCSQRIAMSSVDGRHFPISCLPFLAAPAPPCFGKPRRYQFRGISLPGRMQHIGFCPLHLRERGQRGFFQ